MPPANAGRFDTLVGLLTASPPLVARLDLPLPDDDLDLAAVRSTAAADRDTFRFTVLTYLLTY